MKLLVCLLLFALPLLGCGEKTKLYRITPVVTAEDVQACAKAKGHAGLIADLDKDGNIVSGWIGGCVVDVK